MTGRLDDTLRVLTGYRLRRASTRVMAEFNDVFGEFGLRRITFSTLALVVDRPGLRQSHVAEALAVERANLVQIVDELERADLLRRETAQDDRRAYALQPTQKGVELIAKALPKVRKQDAKLTKGMNSHQIAALYEALDMLVHNAERLNDDDN